MYVIWHDNDYDLALWVYENTEIFGKETRFRKIPKTNNPSDLLNALKSSEDFQILPVIKFATPDIIIQKIDGQNSEVLIAAEFMTHTPHHDHIFQRFERVYCIAKEGIPMSLILLDKKVKIERGTNEHYRPRAYSPSNLTVHTYIKTSLISRFPVLMFFWPTKDGFPIMDLKHPTAPAIESDIPKWLTHINLRVLEKTSKKDFDDASSKQYEELLSGYKFGDGRKFDEISYEELVENINTFYPKLTRATVEDTEAFMTKYKIDAFKAPGNFTKLEKTIVFSYKSRDFRTDPYTGFLCGVKNMFVYDNNGKKRANLVLIPEGISYSKISRTPQKGFHDIPEDLRKCPLRSQKNLAKVSFDEVVDHINSGCIYTLSKQQRIFGTVADMIIFDDYIYYNQHHDD